MNAVFETLFLLQKETYYKKIYYASRTFSALVTAQIVVNSQFGWSPSILNWLQDILLWLSWPVQKTSLQQYYYLLGFTVALLFLAMSVFYHVCRQILAGTMHSPRIIQALRLLLGFVLMLANPITNVFLASFNCDWAGGSNLSLNWDLTENCVSSIPRIILMCVSAALVFLPLLGLVSVSLLMHVSDQQSSMILSRAHSRVDALCVAADIINNVLFVLLSSYPKLLAAIFIALQLLATGSIVVFQPYYHTLTNDLFAMISAVPLWAGVSFATLLALNDDGTFASAVLLAGVVPFGLLVFWASRSWRTSLIKEAMHTNELDTDEETGLLSDEDVFPILRERYDRNMTTFFMTDIKAAIVEVKTRFLLKDESPQAVAIAENILKKGLLEFPQSVYLRLQYVTFLLKYRKEPLLASVRLDEVIGLDIDLDLRFTVLRMKREVEKSRQEKDQSQTGGRRGLDSISYEEIKIRIKDVRALHKKAIELSENVWKTLARKKGAGKKHRHHHFQAQKKKRNQVMPTSSELMTCAPADVLAAVAPIIEELRHVTDRADSEYSILWSQCRDSKEVGGEYARYLRNVKNDTAAADEIEDQLSGRAGAQSEDDRSSRDGASSQGASSTGESVQTLEQQERVKKLATITDAFTGRVSALKLRLRFSTFVLIGAAIASFVTFYMLTSQAVPVFESILEAGNLRSTCVLAAHQLRLMQLSAIKADGATFNKTRSALNSTFISTREIQFGLMTMYRTDFALRNDYMKRQSLDVRRVESANVIVKEKVSPEELMMRVIDLGLEALAQPMSKFSSTLASNLAQFPQFFFVLENSFECSRTTDTLAEMYRLEVNQILSVATQVLIAMCFLIVAVEFWTVSFLFRPAVNRAFQELSVSMTRFVGVPLETAKELRKVESKQLARFRVLAGDDDQGLMDLDDVPEAKFSKMTRSSPQPRGVAWQQMDKMDSFKDSSDVEPTATTPTATRKRITFESPKTIELAAPTMVMDTFSIGEPELVSPKAAFAFSKKDSVLLKSGSILDQLSDTDDEKLNRNNSMDIRTPKSFSKGDFEMTLNRLNESTDEDVPNFRPQLTSRLFAADPSDAGSDTDDSMEAARSATPPKRKGRSPTLIKRRAKSVRPEDENEIEDKPEDKPVEKRADQPRTKWSAHLIVLLRSLLGLGDGQAEMKGTSKRKMPIVMTYLCMLVLLCICIGIVTKFGLDAITNIIATAPGVINSARRRYLFSLAYFFENELYLSTQPTSLIGSALSSWTPDVLKCRLTAAASMGLMMHYTVLYGTEEGFVNLPLARQLPSVDSIIDSECSPSTRDPVLFRSSIQMEGVAFHPLYSNFYFVPQCASTNEFAPNSIQVTDPRIFRRSKSLSTAGCPLFKAGLATNGFHRLTDTSFTSTMQILNVNLSNPVERAAQLASMSQLNVLQDPQTDLLLGFLKINLVAIGDSVDLIYANQSVLGIVFGVIMGLIVLQYAVLGKGIQMLMKSNLSVTLTCERMLENAASTMKKQGYSAAAARKLLKGRDDGPEEGVTNKVTNSEDTSDSDSEEEGQGQGDTLVVVNGARV